MGQQRGRYFAGPIELSDLLALCVGSYMPLDQNHQDYWENESNYPCIVCGKQLQTTVGLRQHMNTHEEKYMFNTCEATFSHKITTISDSFIEYISVKSKRKRKMDPGADLPVLQGQAAPDIQLSKPAVSTPFFCDENKVFDAGDDQSSVTVPLNKARSLTDVAGSDPSHDQEQLSDALSPSITGGHEENTSKKFGDDITSQAPIYSTVKPSEQESQPGASTELDIPSTQESGESEPIQDEGLLQQRNEGGSQTMQSHESPSKSEQVPPILEEEPQTTHSEEAQPTKQSYSYCCYMCGDKFSEKLFLVDHMKNAHLDVNPNKDSEKNSESKNGGRGDVESEGTVDSVADKFMLENKCKLCGQHIREPGHLLRHMRRAHGAEGISELRYQEMTCRFCPKTYSSELSLIRHEARHPSGTAAIQCARCGAVFENFKVLKNHKKQLSDQVSCQICMKIFPNEKCLACHMQISHDMIKNEESCKISDLFSSEDGESKQISGFGKSVLQFVERESDAVSVKERSQCRFCSKNYSNQKRLLRHEMSHPYGTVAIKCNFCDEVLPNYHALKSHKKQISERVLCNVCNRKFPNTSCLSCHTRNSHSTFEDESSSDVSMSKISNTADDDEDDDNDNNDADSNDVDNNDNNLNMEGRLTLEIDTQAKYSTSDTGEHPPVLIRIKRERINNELNKLSTVSNSSDHEGERSDSTSHSAGKNREDSFAIDQGSASTPVESDNDSGDEVEGEIDDEESTNYHEGESKEVQSSVSLDNEEQDKEFASSHFGYRVGGTEFTQYEDGSQTPSVETNDEDSDEDYRPPSPSRGTREEDSSDEGSDYFEAGSSVMKKTAAKTSSRRKLRRKNHSDPLYQSVSEDSADETVDMHFSRYVMNETVCNDESDDDPDWRKTWSSPGSAKRKVSRGKGRGRKLKYEFPTQYVVEKVKRPRVRGCGGKKAEDAAAALAEAVKEMESSAPHLKVVICPLRRSVGGVIMKATVKRSNQIFVDDSDYLVDEKKAENSNVNFPDSGEGLTQEQDKEYASDEDDQSVSELDEKNTVDNYEGNAGDQNRQTIPEQVELSISDHSKLNGSHDCDSQNSFVSYQFGEVENSVTFKPEPIDSEEEEVSRDSLSSRDSSVQTDSHLQSSVKYDESGHPTNTYDSSSVEEVSSRKEIRYICKICGRELQYRSHLLRHLRQVHGGEGVDDVMRRLMKCRFCSKQYSNELSLVHHEKLHDGSNKIKCSKCNESFDDKNALRRHQRKVHWEHQPVCCEICQKQLADSTCLKAHMKHMHTVEERKATVFTCEVCGRQLHTKTAFQNHVASKCGTNLLFPCETCGKSFSFKGSLKAHQLLHSGVRSFLCRFCGKSFHQKGEMKRHERKHTGEKPFVCNECGRAFAYRESLLGHSAVHTGIKPFPCKNCGMRFSCSGNLVKHRRSNNCKGPQQNIPVNPGNPISPETLGVFENSVNLTNPINKENPLTGVNTVSAALVATVNTVSPESLVNPVQSVPKTSDHENTVDCTNIVEPSIISSNLANSLLIARSQEGATKGKVPAVMNAEQRKGNHAESDYRLSTQIMSSVIKSEPAFGMKSSGISSSPPKQMKSLAHSDMSQPSSANTTVNRFSTHVNSVFESQDSNMSTHSSYSTHSHSSNYSNNHFGNSHQRQSNQSSSSDRHFAQFSADVRMGRTEPLLDRQIVARRDTNRQMTDVVDGQASRYLDCFTGVQLSNHADNRSTIQPFPAVVHTGSYSSIHAGPFNYTAAHSGNRTNMYVTSPLLTNQVNFSGFHAGSHLTVNPNSQLPAHSSTHPGYPVTHMSTLGLGALFGHLGQPNIHSGSFPSSRYTTIHAVGPPASSPPSGNN